MRNALYKPRLQEDYMTHPFQHNIMEAKDRLIQGNDYLPYEAAKEVLKRIFRE